jgi:hypothetical protein
LPAGALAAGYFLIIAGMTLLAKPVGKEYMRHLNCLGFFL